MKRRPRGILITFEGIEASGKTTHIKNLAKFLKKAKIKFLLTREPGGTKFGKKIKELIFNPPGGQISAITELLLFSADRQEHLEKVIKPALARGQVVLCDRFVDSTLAYQIGGRNLPAKLVNLLNQISSAGLGPDLTFLFQLDLKEMKKRLMLRGKKINRFEKEKLSFYENIQKYYLNLSRSETRFLVLDGGEPFKKNAEIIRKASLKTIKGF